jgi:hypothetical protein
MSGCGLSPLADAAYPSATNCPSGHAQHSGRHSAPPWLPSIQKSRIHITYSATATAKTANAMEKTACLKMITILSSSKRRSHSLITGQSEQIEGLRLLDWIVPVVR